MADQELKNEIAALREQIEEMSAHLTENSSETAEETIKKVRKQVDSVASQVKDAWGDTSRQAGELKEKAHQYAKENPWQVAAMAAAAGAILGMLAVKKKRKP